MEIFHYLEHHLIQFLPTVLFAALALRYIVYRNGQANQHYFNSFCRYGEKILNSEDRTEVITNIDAWIADFLKKIEKDLPERSVRAKTLNTQSKLTASGATFRHSDKASLTEFADGKRAIIHSVKQQMDAFKSPYPPNFSDLARWVLRQDKKWNVVLGFIPIPTLTRLLDILAGLFVIGGIFGTFIGITSALPLIGQIDLNNLEAAGDKLVQFVNSVAYAMNTSITGIICCVTITILNAAFPINEGRASVTKNLERMFELMWYRIHGGKISSGEESIVTLLEKIHRDLRGGRGSSRSKVA